VCPQLIWDETLNEIGIRYHAIDYGKSSEPIMGDDLQKLGLFPASSSLPLTPFEIVISGHFTFFLPR